MLIKFLISYFASFCIFSGTYTVFRFFANKDIQNENFKLGSTPIPNWKRVNILWKNFDFLAFFKRLLCSNLFFNRKAKRELRKICQKKKSSTFPHLLFYTKEHWHDFSLFCSSLFGIFDFTNALKSYNKYSQTRVQRPPLGPLKSGRCLKVAAI